MSVEATYDYIGEHMGNALHAIHGQLPDEVTKNFYKNDTDQDRVQYMLKQPAVHQVFSIEPNFEGKSAEKAAEFREKGNLLFQKKSYLNATEHYTKCIMHAPYQTEEADETQNVVNGTEVASNEIKPPPEGNETIKPPLEEQDATKPPPEGQDTITLPQEDTSKRNTKTNHLALAFANRSASLFHRKKFQIALQDIELAFEHGYPEELHYKLFDRRGKCYVQLREKNNAINAFQQAKDTLKLTKLDEKGLKTWTVNIDKQLQHCEKIAGSQEKNETRTTEELLPAPQNVKSSHQKYPHMTQDVDVKYKTDRNYGRHVVSNHDIKVGDVIVAEQPFVYLCLPEHYETHCYHCLTRTIAPIPCTKTSSVIFCSKKCRSVAWDQYFKHEWQFLNWFNLGWCGRIGHLVIRLAITQGYDRLINYLTEVAKQNTTVDWLERGLDQDGVYSADFQAVWNLCTNAEVRLPEGLLEFSCFAIFLLKILQKSGFFPKETGITPDTKDSDVLSEMGGILLHFLQFIQCNAQRINMVKNPTEFEDLKLDPIGMGIYPTVSLFNHNCDPNAVLVFHGNQAVVKATRDISKKEEVTIDYGWYFYKHGYNERRGNLGFRYSFDCKCKACRERWPLHVNLESTWPQFKCWKCGRELTTSKALDGASVRCMHCDHEQDIQEGIRQLQVSHDVYADSMQEATAGKPEKALPGLQGHLQLMQKLLLPPWRDLTACQAAVRNCYQLQGNVRLLA